jgi:amino acid adenylation domain-containing protein
MNGPASRFARLSAGQLKALRTRAAAARIGVSARPRSGWVALDDGRLALRLPCSYAQSRLWFLEQWEGGSGLYHIVSAYRLVGGVDACALQGALDDLVARHEALRTGFVEEGGEPLQRIVSSARVALTEADLRAIAPGEREATLRAQLQTHAVEAFDLGEAPLLRAGLWRLGDGEWVLQLVIHHITSDGWSQGVLNRELGALYAARCRGVQAQLDALPVQYADYALWQRETLSGAGLQGALGYWKEKLSGLAVLGLPTDRARPAQPSYRGAVVRFGLDAALTGRLRGLAREAGGTLYMVLLAAFKVLLSRHSGQSDIAVGTPVAGRGQVELEGLIGFFVNTLVLRTQVEADEDFMGVLGRVKETALGAFDHAQMPFEKLVEELRPVRDPSRNPLFQVMFALQNAPHEELELSGAEVQRQGLEREIAKFDLTLELTETETDGGQGLSGVFEYATDLFDAGTVERLVGHYRRLLEGIVSQPRMAVCRLPLLTDQERQQLLVEWNDTAAAYPEGGTLASLFEAQVERSPGSVALECGDDKLSYGELNARANRIAHALRGLGVGPEVRVGLYLERSVDLVAGVLGILKVGGAYVPLDPSYPAARIAYMVEDTAAPVVLTHSGLVGKLPAHAGRTVCVDDAALIGSQSGDNPEAVGGAASLAYVIYTSGSTGQPKGVMVSHAAVCNRMHWLIGTFGITAADAMLVQASINFDVSIGQLFACLLTGGRCVLAREDERTDSAALVALTQAHAVSIWDLTPSMLRPMLDEPGIADCRTLRHVFCGGEALDPALAGVFHSRMQAGLHNVYGPTETAIDATWWTCEEGWQGAIPIGRPISNMQAWVLDDTRQPVAVGVAGELYLGGVGLARGYLGQPELTAEKFVAHPFSDAPGARLYRTGDRVRWLADGTIEFLGRFDDQVKLRGFRIEPGEIEAALMAQAGVKQAAVVVREDRPGERRLVAYVAGAGLEAGALRTQLGQSLPAHMLPSALVLLEALPITANGKLDRAALPAPDLNAVRDDYVAPRTEQEAALAALWAEVLGVSRVGVHDNFFELGGHSLLAARLASRLHGRVARRVSLRDVFDAPTVGRMAHALQQSDADTPDVSSALTMPALRPRTAPVRDVLAQATFPQDSTLASLFEAQVERSPGSVALECGDDRLSYGELNTRANRIARVLCALGVGPDVPVVLFMPRSVELVVGLLGVIKAGGAYVPIDVSLPPARIAYMAEDSGAPVVLTLAALRGRLPDYAGRVLCLDLDDDLPAIASADALLPAPRPADLAYVIYTSGSTGRPKGVMVSHAAICNHMHWMLGTFGFTEADRILQKTSISADASVWEFMAPLLGGGRLVLAAEGSQRDPAALLRQIRTFGITVLQVVPSLLKALVAEPGFADCRSLRQVFCGGETLDAPLATTFFSRSGARLHNLYGPTEAAIDATWWTCEKGWTGSIPIGRPITNMQAWVLDEARQPLPVGVIGELYLGGVGLARGYLGRPELTAEKFVAHPFSDEPGARLYRTGDRARWRADGTIEFLGRIDHQIKMRGFRIEPGEIEAALLGDAAVSQTVVVLREDRPGDQRLVAYVVGREGGDPDIARLRAVLGKSLPEHMVPSAIVRLDALPITAHGKLDRAALPAPEFNAVRDDYVAPRTEQEAALAALWSEVLGVPQVGVHDSFFELGGHSLLAVQLVSRLRGMAGREVSLRDVFEAPSVAGMAVLMQAESPAPVVGEDVAGIQVRHTSEHLPCSYAQSRLWFLEQWEGGSGLYHIVSAYRLVGGVDACALQGALDDLVARHEALRTGFVEEGGEPLQRIVSSARVALTEADLRAIAPGEREATLRAQLQTHAVEAFDLGEAPLLRAGLWRLGDGEWVLQLVIHHITSDGWSQGVLNRELGALYAARCRGVQAQLDALPVQYADYALWQRETLSGAGLQGALGYWKEKLSGLAVLGLPTDRARPAQPSYRGAVVRFGLDAALTGRLRGLAREAGGTLYMVLLAAFKVLLSRHSGQSDIAVGTPVAGRGQVELEGLIGFFVNTLVLRTQVEADEDFMGVLGRVKETALGAFDHAQMPFEKLVEELRPVRDPSRNPLFQVMFALQNAPHEELELSGAEVQRQGLEREIAKFDLTLELTETETDGGQGLSGVFEYATDLFDAGTVERLVGHYRRLLEGIVSQPRMAVCRLPLLTDQERQQLLVEWNDTAAAYPEGGTLASLFEAQVERSPGSVALECGDDKLSYGELNARANRIAHALRGLGVGPEVRVGLYLERSVDLVAGVLGILKVGGAYVPLDPSYPAARIAYMVEDTAAPVVLTHSGLVGKLPAHAGRTVCVDDAALIGSQSGDNPEAVGGAASLAYVIYTSGSTGQPKGVMVEQHSVARLVFGTDYARFGPEETFLLLAPMAFDASTFELWGALLHGSRCVIHPLDVPTAAGLQTLIERHGVSTLWLTAALFNVLIDERPEALRGLRQLLTGGEALSVAHVRRALAALPGVQLINGYGPTESTTFTCCHRIPSQLPASCTSIPIGRPIGNTEVLILDAQCQPVAVGVEGELYIGGAGLARGYLGRPELTAEKFVAHPFSDAPGARLYRTGDRVRWLADGTIEFLGRFDDQVKLRGFRIEPGEIEAALMAQAGVKQAAVVVREDRPGERRLVAYVAGAGLEAGALRTQLGQSLPAHMLPSAFVLLEALPITANGKLDRAALPAPEALPGTQGGAASQPRDIFERHLLGIWESLFERGGIGVDQDFFAMGGHSLLALRLVEAIARTFGTRLPLDTFWFRGNTIRDIAGLLREQSGRGRWPLLVPIKPAGDLPPLFCVHTIGGNLFHYFDLARALSPRQPVLGLNALGVDGQAAPRSSVRDIAADCIVAMREAQPRGPYRLAGFSSGGTVAFEMAQQLRAAGDEVAVLALIDTYAPGVYLRPAGGGLIARLAGAVRPYLKRERLEHAVLNLFGRTPRQGFPDAASAHWWAHWGYRPQTYAGRVDLYIAEESRIEASKSCLGWSARVSGGFEMHPVPGTHGLMVKPPVVDELARLLQRRLDEELDEEADDPVRSKAGR